MTAGVHSPSAALKGDSIMGASMSIAALLLHHALLPNSNCAAISFINLDVQHFDTTFQQNQKHPDKLL